VKSAAAAGFGAVQNTIRARRRRSGASFGGLPVANLVVIEVGLAIGVCLVAVDRKFLIPGAAIAGLAVIFALLRRHGRWFTQWIGLTLRYLFRSHTRVAQPVVREEFTTAEEAESPVLGPDDARVNLLRLVLPDLVVTTTKDHERKDVGLAYHNGMWTAVLLIDPLAPMVTAVNASPSLPIGALAPCLSDRGVVLDSIQVLWHSYPGSTALPTTSPAVSAYQEVLGSTSAIARRSTWVAVRLDPRKCGEAITERGGGVIGAHRAVIGALSRVRNALSERGLRSQSLDSNALLHACLSSTELVSMTGATADVSATEKWSNITTGNIGHSSYAISSWPTKTGSSITALTGVRALSTTVSMTITPTDDTDGVGLRGLVRISARTPQELDDADQKLDALADRLDIDLTPLHGLQAAGLAATLPLGGEA
jgi:type VII secretion protein EccE